MNHTQAPWENRNTSKFGPGEIYAKDEYICTTSGNAQANAEFIVKACNAHADLLEACQKGLSILKVYQHELDKSAMPWPEIQDLEEAIRKAT